MCTSRNQICIEHAEARSGSSAGAAERGRDSGPDAARRVNEERQQRVVEERRPFLERAIRGEDKRAALGALADDLVEVHRFLALERAEAQVIDDQEVAARQACEAVVVGGVGTGGAELGEELMGPGVEDAVAGRNKPLPDRTWYAGLVERRSRKRLLVGDQEPSLFQHLDPSLGQPSDTEGQGDMSVHYRGRQIDFEAKADEIVR
jgi:hypothetical protein